MSVIFTLLKTFGHLKLKTKDELMVPKGPLTGAISNFEFGASASVVATFDDSNLVPFKSTVPSGYLRIRWAGSC
jgi:hypothetical protein